MKIILENVQKGSRVTGVAKVMNGALNVGNVPFNVGSVGELDSFCTSLLAVQTEFSNVADGEYVVTPKPITPADPIAIAKQATDVAWEDLQKERITKEEYSAIVQLYKNLIGEK